MNGTYDDWFIDSRRKDIAKIGKSAGIRVPRDIVLFFTSSFDLSPIKGRNGHGPSAKPLPKIDGIITYPKSGRKYRTIKRRRYSKTCGELSLLNHNAIPWCGASYWKKKKKKDNSPSLWIPRIFICQEEEMRGIMKGQGNLTRNVSSSWNSISFEKRSFAKTKIVFYIRLGFLFPPTLCRE